MRPTWPRCRIAAGATSRPTCAWSLRRSPRCAASPSSPWRRRPRRTPTASSGSRPPGASSVGGTGGPAPAAPRERELVLDPEPQDHGVARARQAEAGPGDELEPARELAVEHGEHVVLLLARGVGAADLPDVPEEFDPGNEVPREPVVHARPVVELERPALLAHGGQLEAGIQIDGEPPEVARHDGPELELQVRFAPVRYLRLDVPAEVERIAPLLEERAPRAHA